LRRLRIEDVGDNLHLEAGAKDLSRLWPPSHSLRPRKAMG
jgi:hypothetical protein